MKRLKLSKTTCHSLRNRATFTGFPDWWSIVRAFNVLCIQFGCIAFSGLAWATGTEKMASSLGVCLILPNSYPFASWGVKYRCNCLGVIATSVAPSHLPRTCFSRIPRIENSPLLWHIIIRPGNVCGWWHCSRIASGQKWPSHLGHFETQGSWRCTLEPEFF